MPIFTRDGRRNQNNTLQHDQEQLCQFTAFRNLNLSTINEKSRNCPQTAFFVAIASSRTECWMTISAKIFHDPIIATARGTPMPDASRTPGAPWSAQSSGSCLSIAHGWLALFGPRPSFIFSTRRAEADWQQWQDAGRYHGLVKFRVGSDGWMDSEPMQATPREKPCRVSSRQWEAV